MGTRENSSEQNVNILQHKTTILRNTVHIYFQQNDKLVFFEITERKNVSVLINIASAILLCKHICENVCL